MKQRKMKRRVRDLEQLEGALWKKLLALQDKNRELRGRVALLETAVPQVNALHQVHTEMANRLLTAVERQSATVKRVIEQVGFHDALIKTIETFVYPKDKADADLDDDEPKPN